MTSTTTKPPGEVEVTSASDLQGGDPAAILREALDELLGEWTTRLDRDLTGRMRKVLTKARDAHRAAMETAGLDPTDQGQAPTFDAMRDYRKAVLQEVVRPLLQLANEADPGRRTGTMMDRLYDGLVAVARDAPEALRRPAPPDRYKSSEEDGAIRTALKGLFRGGQGVAGVFRSSAPEQTIRLRSIAAAALQRDDVEEGGTVAEALFQYHAQVMQQIEMALGIWMRDWLPLENANMDAEAHLDPADRERLALLRQELKASTVEAGAENPSTADESNAETGTQEREGTGPPLEGEASAEEPAPDSLGPGGVAARLQETLEGLGDLPAPEPFLSELRQRFDHLAKRLEDRIREGGTPFARTALPGNRRLARSEKRREARREEWREWFDASIDRIRLTEEFLGLRSDGGHIVNELYQDTLHDSVFFLAERIEDSQEGLLTLRNRAPEVSPKGDDADVAESMASDTWSIEEEARKLLEERLLQPLAEQNPRARVERASADAVDALGQRLGHLPQMLSVHPIRESGLVVSPDQPVRNIPLRAIARQGLDVLHLEGLRTAPAPLLDYLTRVEGECRQVVEMVAYSLSSAREALLGRDAPEDAPEEDPDAPPPPEDDETEDSIEEEETGVEAAQTLSLEGLERAADSLAVILAPAITAWEDFAQAAQGTLKDGRENMHARLVVEGTVQEQLRDFRSLARSWWRGGLESARRLQMRYGPPLRRRAMRLYFQGLRLVRRGRLAMGGTDTRGTELAADVLGRIPTLLDPLPLIYRRLYSFQPLTDPSLLIGRDPDRGWLTTQI